MNLPKGRDDLTKFLVEQFHKVRDEMAPMREKWSVYWALVNSYVDTDTYPLPFTTFYPLPWSIFQTELPRFEHNLLARQPLFAVDKGDRITPDEAVDSVRRLVEEWFGDADTRHTLVMMAAEGLVCGTTGAKIEYRHIQRKRVRAQRFDAGMQTFAVDGPTDYEDVINKPVLVHRDMYDIYPDLNFENQNEMRFVADVSIQSMDDLRAQAEEFGYKNLAALADDGDWKQDGSERYNRLREVQIGETGSGDSTQVEVYDQEVWPDNPRHILEFAVRTYEKDPIQGRTIEVIRLITIGNEKYLLRDIEIPYWPWVFWRNNPMPGQFLGRSEFQPIEGLIFGINNVLNMMQTNMLGSISQTWLVGDDAEVDPDQLVLDPFNVVQGGNVSPDNIRLQPGPQMNRDGGYWMDKLAAGVQEATGLSDTMRGQSGPRKEYVSTNMMQSQAAEARIDKKLKEMGRELLVRAAQTKIECAQHQMTSKVLVSGPDGLTEVDRFAIQGRFRFKINPAAIGIKEMQRASINEAMSIVNQLLQTVGPGHPLELPVLRLKLTMGQQAITTFDGDWTAEAKSAFVEVLNAISSLSQQGAGGPGDMGGAPPLPAGQGSAGSAGLDGLAAILGAAPGGAAPPAGAPLTVGSIPAW